MYAGIEEGARHLVDMMFAPIYQKICITAVKMDVFTRLQTPSSAGTLAQMQGWHEGNTAYLLNVLTGMGLLQKKGQIYQNTPVSQKHLVSGGEYYMGDFMQMYLEATSYDEGALSAFVKNGPAVEQENKDTNISFADMIDKMRNAQMGARCAEFKSILAGIPEYPLARKMLDLGGGAGMMGITAAKGNPELSVTVYDIPPMKEGIEKSIQIYQMEERVAALAGDYIQDEIGSGYDMIVAFATLNFAKHSLDAVLKKLLNALNKGGVLITFGDGIHPDGTRPVDMVAGWLPYTLKGMDFGMPSGLLSETALRVGFQTANTTTIAAYTGTSELCIIRK